MVKDEKMIGLGGATNIWVMEEGEMKGICAEVTREKAEEFKRRQEAAEKKRNSIGYKVLRRLRGGRREGEKGPQCEVQ